MAGTMLNLTDILDQLLENHPIKKDEVKFLLGLSDPREIEKLFKAARKVRELHFGNRIFLYGFLYFSTYCRNNCNFCQYRVSNKALSRYRKTPDQILLAAMEMAEAGVHLIDLTMGEDPQLYSDSFGATSDSAKPGASVTHGSSISSGENAFSELVDMVQKVQTKTKSPVMISPGTLPDEIIKALADAGTTWYALYQETHNPDLYKSLRHGQDFEKRLEKKRLAKSLGMLIEEGILTGVGETQDDLADSIIWMKDFSVDQARVMTFVPQEGTPMANAKARDSLKERIIIAVMRLVLGDCLIPASLDVDGLSGLKARLDAGANVVTSIVPPQKGLAGVANNSLDIEDSRRTLAYILPVLNTCGLLPATLESYHSWITQRQNISKETFPKKEKARC